MRETGKKNRDQGRFQELGGDREKEKGEVVRSSFECALPVLISD